MDFPILYARAKTGRMKRWQIKVQPPLGEHPPRIIIAHAASPTAMEVVTHEDIAQGKNLGKANETTPHEQACLEAKSRWNKKRDQGYTEEMPADDQKRNSNSLGLPQPMLALPLEKFKGNMPDQVWVQPKLDGHRAMVGWVDGRVRMWSRRGKWIDTMDHIIEPLWDVLPVGLVLDGELYRHGERLQNLGSLIKRKQPDSETVEYHVYDCMFAGMHSDIWLFGGRLDHLSRVPLPVDHGAIVRVPTQACAPDLIEHYFHDFRAKGYEGAMVRLDTHPYEAGFRSQSLLKVKEFQDAEWTVRSVLRGTPKVVGGTEYQIGILDCGDFRVTAPGTVEEKHHVFHNAWKYVGKKVTVKYAFLTREGVPFHPVALRFREDI